MPINTMHNSKSIIGFLLLNVRRFDTQCSRDARLGCMEGVGLVPWVGDPRMLLLGFT